MEYDLEMIVPVCKKYEQRIHDFKKFGIMNVGENKIFLNLIVSNDEKIDDIEVGWPENVDVKVCVMASSNYVGNVFKFISEIYPQDLRSRWIARLDDDSSTDIGGLIKNLDEFYDHNKDFYLASACFDDILMSPEIQILDQYEIEMGAHRKILFNLRHEIECCVLSATAVKTIFSNKMSVELLKKRSCVDGGVTDVALALAAAMAKVYPIECPFLSHLPHVSEFSIANGMLNHIHMVSRDSAADNFERTGIPFLFLERLIHGANEVEKSMENLKFFSEKDDRVELIHLQSNHIFKVKFEKINMIWIEHENKILVLDKNIICRSFDILPDGNLLDTMSDDNVDSLFVRVDTDLKRSIL
jgi:hypothetical protein